MKVSIIKRQKKEHPLWKIEERLKEVNPLLSRFRQWQYYFESKKGKISMIHFLKHSFSSKPDSDWIWEIYAYENPKLFTDIIRFKTKKQAEKAIKKYLE